MYYNRGTTAVTLRPYGGTVSGTTAVVQQGTPLEVPRYGSRRTAVRPYSCTIVRFESIRILGSRVSRHPAMRYDGRAARRTKIYSAVYACVYDRLAKMYYYR